MSRSSKLRSSVVVALFVLALVVGWLVQAMRPHSWSQKITAEITVDGKPLIGSSIAHVPQHFMLNTCYGAATSCADE